MKKNPTVLPTLYLFLITGFLAGCAQSGPPTQESASEIPASLPPLSLPFQTDLINPLDTPHTYVDSTCRYLKYKWNPYHAAPGTVVMIIRIGEVQPALATNPSELTPGELSQLMHELKFQGFEAITTKEFLNFIERNIKIPFRSVLLIQDGNHDRTYYDRFYRQYWEEWGWTIINSWQSDPNLPENLWGENIELELEGFIDHQAYGVLPNTTLSDESGKTVIARELQIAIKAFEKYYIKMPYSITWPNGGFGLRPVEAARLLKYQLGFTSNQRGPVMYNWIPLANEADPERPEFLPEGTINAPLMTLPRYPAGTALTFIDQVRTIGEDSAAHAELNKDTELFYYDMVCSEDFGKIPVIP